MISKKNRKEHNHINDRARRDRFTITRNAQFPSRRHSFHSTYAWPLLPCSGDELTSNALRNNAPSLIHFCALRARRRRLWLGPQDNKQAEAWEHHSRQQARANPPQRKGMPNSPRFLLPNAPTTQQSSGVNACMEALSIKTCQSKVRPHRMRKVSERVLPSCSAGRRDLDTPARGRATGSDVVPYAMRLFKT